LHEVYEDCKHVYIVTDLVRGEELFALLKRGKCTELKAKKFIKDILMIVNLLHSLHIIHWDIKPENLLYDEENESVWLVDFGLSYQFKDNDERLHVPCGSPGYVAPEVVNA